MVYLRLFLERAVTYAAALIVTNPLTIAPVFFQNGALLSIAGLLLHFGHSPS